MLSFLLAILLQVLPSAHVWVVPPAGHKVSAHRQRALVGRGTVYGPRTDGEHHKASFACDYPARRAHQSREAKRLFAKGMFFAAKKMACWRVVKICSLDSGKCARATRADWGPRSSMLDLYEQLATVLQHKGGRVRIVWGS